MDVAQAVAQLPPQMIILLIVLVVAWNAAMVALLRWMFARVLRHSEQRLIHIEKLLEDSAADNARQDRELNGLREEMLRDFVRREDFLRQIEKTDSRYQSLDAKLDALLMREPR